MDRTRNDRTMTALVTTAAVLAWSGIHSLSSPLDLDLAGKELYLATQLISVIVLFWVASTSVSAGNAHIATVPMMLGLSILTGACGTLIDDYDSVSVLRVSFVLPLIVAAAMMWSDKQKPLAVSTALMAAALATIIVSRSVYGTIMMLSGTAMALSVFCRASPVAMEPAKACRMLLLELIAVHAGMMLLSHGLLLGSYMGVTISVAIAVASASMFGHGMVMAGCSGILYSFTGLIAGIPIMEESIDIDIIPLVNLACIAVGALAFVGGERALGAGMAAFGAGLTASVLGGESFAIALGSGAILALCLAETVRTWRGQDRENEDLDRLGRIAGVSVAGIMILSMALLSNVAVELSDGAKESLNHITIIGCAFMVGFSIMAMRGRMLTEAMVFLMTACCILIFPLAGVIEDPNGLMPIGISLCVGFAVASYIYWRMRAPMRALGCALMVVSLLVAGSGAEESIRLVPMAMAGLVFLAISLKKAYRFGVASDARIEDRANMSQSDNQYAVVLISLATYILMILALIGEMSDLMPAKSLSLSIFRLMLLFSILGFGMYAVKMGLTALGTYLLGSFLLCFLMASLPLVGLRLPMELNMLSSVLFIASIMAFCAAGNRMMIIISSLMLLSVVAEPLMSSTWGFDLIVLIFKTASGLVALTLWIEYDVGRIIVPKYSKLWRKDAISEGPERPIRPCILFSCLILASVMALWTAAGPFIPETGITAFHIAVATSAILCIVLSAPLFHEGSPDWGAFVMLLSIGSLSYAASGLLGSGWGAELSVGLPLAVLAATRLAHGSKGVPAMCIAAIVAFFLMDPAPVAGSAAMAAIGAVMAVVGSRGMIQGRSWTAPTDLGSGWAVAMAATVGLCISVQGTDGMLVSSVVASAFVMMAGFGCGSQGRHAECLALLSASIPGFAASAAALAGADLSATPLVIPAALMAASTVMFHGDGKEFGTILCGLGAVLVLISIATGSWIPATVGCGIACLAVILSGLGTERGASIESRVAGE